MTRWRLLSLFLVLLAGNQFAWPWTPGTFRGVIVGEPQSAEANNQDWIYVEGRNHMVRRVALAHAEIIYAEDVSAGEREKDPARSLIPGAEVRVTAEQDGSGEWRAQRIEILKIAPVPAEKAPRTSS